MTKKGWMPPLKKSRSGRLLCSWWLWRRRSSGRVRRAWRRQGVGSKSEGGWVGYSTSHLPGSEGVTFPIRLITTTIDNIS